MTTIEMKVLSGKRRRLSRHASSNVRSMVLGRSPLRRTYRFSGRQALNIRSAGFVGIERKFIDSGKVASVVTSGTTLAGREFDPAPENCLNATTQGTGPSQRLGTKISVLNCFINGVVELPTQTSVATAHKTPLVRVYLLLDKQTNAAQFNSEDVFTTAVADAAAATAPLRNLLFVDRFRILAERTLTLPTQSVAFASDDAKFDIMGHEVPFKIFYKFKKPLICLYKASAGTIADIVDNSLHIIAISSTGTNAKIAFNARVRFTG